MGLSLGVAYAADQKLQMGSTIPLERQVQCRGDYMEKIILAMDSGIIYR